MPRRCLVALLLAGAGPAHAAPPLPDPTQPPMVRAATAPARPPARASAPAPRPRLTSILITQRGEASAWLDGQLVRVGARLPGGEAVARIDTQGVTLQGPQGAQRLWLLVDVAPRTRAAEPEPKPPAPRVELAERSTP